MLSVSKIVNNRNGAFKLFLVNDLRVPKRHEQARNLERIGRICVIMTESRDLLAVCRDLAADCRRLRPARVVIAPRINLCGQSRGPLAGFASTGRHASRPNRRSCARRRIRRPRQSDLGCWQIAGQQSACGSLANLPRPVRYVYPAIANQGRRKFSRKFQPSKF